MSERVKLTEDGLLIAWGGDVYLVAPDHDPDMILAGIIITSPPFADDITDEGELPDGRRIEAGPGTRCPQIWAACLQWLMHEILGAPPPRKMLTDDQALDYIEETLAEHGLRLMD